MSPQSSEFCTVQLHEGPINLSTLQNSDVSTFQGLLCTCIMGMRFILESKTSIKTRCPLSVVQNSGVALYMKFAL